MKLASFTASYPLHLVDATVTYQVPRLPSAFEKMVLRLVEAGAEPALEGASLRSIFEGMLGVADAALLLRGLLRDLIILEVLQPPAKEPVWDAPVSAWRLTDLGREFWSKGQLPGRRQSAALRYLFDPIADRLHVLAAGSSVHDLTPRGAHVLPPELGDTDLAPRIAAALPVEKHAWWRAGTEIMDVQVHKAGVGWRQVGLHVACAGDGKLTLTASDPAFSRWLAQADGELLWERLLAPALGATSAANMEAAERLDLQDAVFAAPLSAPPVEAGRQRRLLVLVEGEEASSDADVVRLQAEAADPALGPEPPSPQSPIILSLPTPPGLPRALRRLEVGSQASSPEAVLEGPVALYWGGQQRIVPLRVGLSAPASGALWQPVREAITECLVANGRLRDLPLRVWGEEPAQVVAHWLQRTGNLRAPEWFQEASYLLAALHQRLGVRAAFAQEAWIAALVQNGQSLLDRLRPRPGVAEGVPLLAASKALPLQKNPLPGKVLSVLQPADSLAQLQQLRQALQDPKHVLAAGLLGPAAREALLVEAMTGASSPSCGPHALVRAVQEFVAVWQDARGKLPPVLWQAVDRGSPEWQRALRAHAARARQIAATLEQAMAAVSADLGWPSGEMVPALAGWRDVLHAWVDWLQRHLAPPLPDAQRAIVLDTNSLIDFPDLPSMLPPSDIPYLPKVVLEELDGLKKPRGDDERAQGRAARARRATVAIDKAGDRIRTEGSKQHLCASDWGESADNAILSLAVYLSQSRVVLLTSDGNLQIKARAEAVRAMSPSEYLDKLKPVGKPGGTPPHARRSLN